MKKLTTRQIALNGVAAGLYAAITILTASFAYGNIQFRIADALCVLVVLEPTLTVGLTLGCLISNIFSTVSALDIVIGTAGTLLGCLLAARVKKDWLVPVPIMLANAVLVGAMLAYVLTPTALVQGFFINGGEVLLGEAVVLFLLGAAAQARQHHSQRHHHQRPHKTPGHGPARVAFQPACRQQAADQAGPAAAVIDPFPHCQNLPFVLNFW